MVVLGAAIQVETEASRGGPNLQFPTRHVRLFMYLPDLCMSFSVSVLVSCVF